MRDSKNIFGIFVFKRGKKYNDIYETLVSKKDIFSNMQELFFFAASIGFKKHIKESFEPGLDMHADYLSSESVDIFFTLFLNDKQDANAINNQEEIRSYLKNDVVEYAEGGMKYLTENVFNNTWNSSTLTLREDYDDYLEDIMVFIKSENEEDLF